MDFPIFGSRAAVTHGHARGALPGSTSSIKERFMRTLKEELLWLEEFAGLDEAQDKLSVWIDFYNKRYLHSALGYKSPMEYEHLYQEEDLGKAA